MKAGLSDVETVKTETSPNMSLTSSSGTVVNTL